MHFTFLTNINSMCESGEQRNDYERVNNSVSIEEGQKSLRSEANISHICYRFPGTIKITRLSVGNSCFFIIFSKFQRFPVKNSLHYGRHFCNGNVRRWYSISNF